MDKSSNYLFLAVMLSTLSLILSVLSTKIYISIAQKFKFFSVPHKGGVRKEIIPTSGGISFGLIYLAMLLSLNHFLVIPHAYLLTIIFGCGIMLLVGFIDDIYGLSSGIRLVLQLIFVLLVCYTFEIHKVIHEPVEYLILFPIIIFGSIWIINTFNFIDGADGLVATNSSIFALIGGLFLYFSNQQNLALILFMLSSLNLGFLFHNWSPAKIFMGDSGSLFLGSLFVVFTVGAFSADGVSYWTWITLLSIFYVETTVTLIVRIKRRENALKVHHSHHAYQQIIIKSGKHYKPALFSIVINSLWVVPMSILSYLYPEKGFLIAIMTCLPLSILFYMFGPYRTK
mgnify:CR=1 FL=1